MKFSSELLSGRLIRRYKRFLADVQLDDGREVTAHTANTGAMLGCCAPGSRVWLSESANHKRKYPYTWELVEVDSENGKTLVCINTFRANLLVAEAIERGLVREFSGYNNIRTEVRYGRENSRIDLLLTAAMHSALPECYVEVKNVTLAKDNVGYFPDAISARAVKHLRELMAMVQQGARAVIFFCVPREDVREVRPADYIDPHYAETLQLAVQQGVEAMAYGTKVRSGEILLLTPLSVIVD